MNKEEYVNEIGGIYKDCIEIVKRKSADYANDENPFQNFENSSQISGVPLEQTIMVRIADKISRMQNLLTKEPDVVEEKIDDTIKDLINYSAILLTYLKQK